MKNVIKTIIFLMACSLSAQIHTELPLKSHSDFELSRPVKYVKIATYEATEKAWDPVMTQVISFNNDNQLIQEYTRILGKFASETAYNYIYNGKNLDSINILASASNFNIKGAVKTDANGRVLSETAKGFYADYNRIYQYNTDGTVKAITTNHASGSHNWTKFTYEKGQLSLVTQVDGNTLKGSPINYFLYNKGKLFAQWSDVDNNLTLSPTNYRHYLLKKHPSPLATAQEIKKLFNTNEKAYQARIKNISNEAIFVHQQGDSKNEQGDWTKKMTKTLNFGQEQKRYSFREIVYADGSTSGSTEFDYLFFKKMKDL
jgi:hypothetical protein